jgi:hypothetical protein
MSALSATISAPGLKATLQQAQDLGIERLGAVEQNEVDRFGKIDTQRLERISFPDLHNVDHAGGLEVRLSPRRLGWLELAGDQTPAAIVLERCGEVQGRDAKRGSELDNRSRARASRQYVKQRAGLARHGERNIF